MVTDYNGSGRGKQEYSKGDMSTHATFDTVYIMLLFTFTFAPNDSTKYESGLVLLIFLVG